jgi:hypothetical protein
MKFSEEAIREAMTNGSIDRLTTISRKKLKKEIEKLEKEMSQTNESEKWKTFFTYFRKTWIRTTMLNYGFKIMKVMKK